MKTKYDREAFSKYEFEKKFCTQEWENYEKERLIMVMRRGDSDVVWDWIESKVKEERKQAKIELIESMIEERNGWSGDGLQILTKKLNQLKND